MRASWSFVASLIYAGLIILGMFVIITSILSVFDGRSDFENDMRSFARWFDSPKDSDFVLQIDEDEGFVFGYKSACDDRFHPTSICSDNQLCLCVVRTDDSSDDPAFASCVARFSSLKVDGVNKVGGDQGCVSSYDRGWIFGMGAGDRAGVYSFSYNGTTNVIDVTRLT